MPSLSGSRDSVQGRACEEGLHFLFGGAKGFGLATVKKRCVAEEPVGIGFFGAEGQALERTSLTEQTDCVDNLHTGSNERTWINERTAGGHIKASAWLAGSRRKVDIAYRLP
jgi:hypothetical protein